ncbi:MAG: phytanoyl-CoA dioxygenase family protein [Actinobacteria bacterium]|nr:phytanoyl-CoA dioxygenase family protein [Actinomycetota bacterium]
MTTVGRPAELDEPYPLTDEQMRKFERDGYVKLRGVLSAEVLDSYEPEITGQVIDLNTQHLPLAERDTYGRAFLQIENLWRHSPVVESFVRSTRLARLAAELLQVRGVRLYHDQALYKEAGGGITPWHVDQYYWPLSSDRTVTVWIPLQDTPDEMGPLTFAAGSHRAADGRELVISDESEQALAQFVTRAGYPVDDLPYALGDVSFHTGWTVHRAGTNTTPIPRRVMTIIYMDADIEITEPDNQWRRADWRNWLSEAPVGGHPDGPLNPILYAAPGRPGPTLGARPGPRPGVD